MGLLKNFFKGKEISADEQMRRNQKTPSNPNAAAKPSKTLLEMSQEELLNHWGRVAQIPAPGERIGPMEELAEIGFEAAYISVAEAYMEHGIDSGSFSWDRIVHWLSKASEAGMPGGIYRHALICLNPDNPKGDVDTGVNELCRAALLGVEEAIQHLRGYLNPANPELAEVMTQVIHDKLEPSMAALLARRDRLSLEVLGQFYYYGLYFPQDFGKAKELFTEAWEKHGSRLAQRILESPVFEDDEEDDED